jgi:molybdopterin molybdotransferase
MEGVTVEQAQALVLEHTPVITETEKKDFPDALHRILAEDMTTSFDNPPFDRSPVDGYACRAQDLVGASKDTPVTLCDRRD